MSMSSAPLVPWTTAPGLHDRVQLRTDKLTEADVFKRTYLGHGRQSSVFVFQGHPGPFRAVPGPRL